MLEHNCWAVSGGKCRDIHGKQVCDRPNRISVRLVYTQVFIILIHYIAVGCFAFMNWYIGYENNHYFMPILKITEEPKSTYAGAHVHALSVKIIKCFINIS